jgi:protein phosphatase
MSSRFETGAATHTGRVRAENEDAHIVLPEAGLWAVSDGMGGHEAGGLASSTIVRGLGSIKPQSSVAHLLAVCEECVLGANDYLNQIGKERGGVIVGATLAVLLAQGADYACLWAGDSRIYRVREGEIRQISRDHTEVQALIDQRIFTPLEGKAWPRRSVITRAIGVSPDPGLEVENGILLDGDAFVICSDGLTEHVSDSEIAKLVSTRPSQDACDHLVALSLERGGTDNVTVIVVRCQDFNPAPSGNVSGRAWE